jgi:hypothetical protein
MGTYNSGYLADALKTYVKEYHSIRAHKPGDCTGALAEAYALVYLTQRIMRMLELTDGLQTNAA